MADQVFTITSSVLLVDTDAEKRWQFSVRPAFLDVFVPEGVDERSLYRLILSTDTVFPILIRLLISASSSGHDLDEAWETADEGLIFAQGGSSVTVPGPDHVDNDLSDANETYRWFPPPALGTDLLEWAFTTLDTAADFTLTFRTPAAGPNPLVTASVPGRAGGASLAPGGEECAPGKGRCGHRPRTAWKRVAGAGGEECAPGKGRCGHRPRAARQRVAGGEYQRAARGPRHRHPRHGAVAGRRPGCRPTRTM